MAQWPQFITQSFNSALAIDPTGKDESVFHGPYTRLLYSLFSLDGLYEIAPKYKFQGTQDAFELVTIFVVEPQRHPVFFIEVRPSASLPYDSKREEADNQMRRRVRDLRVNLTIPVLYGVSAFGTRLSFYRYDTGSQVLTPEQILVHPTRLTDVAPADRWNCDVLQADGAQRLREVVEQVKQMCARI
ncbi:hypothetical protein F5J12DRAFT_717407 [Pisolithus orientalis]|uniref:uncharacterized protein n=1 Tax=Pisolithus orientalis TaxID=936130 RepID=UPI0022257E17|nr:uncharacterized protein F5J12DRAFT_717407 [Pisolithus orientalis]KAI6015329.1 hypothetical protein F5J12DRAFT_717407 [Pisolithus orientalis]